MLVTSCSTKNSQGITKRESTRQDSDQKYRNAGPMPAAAEACLKRLAEETVDLLASGEHPTVMPNTLEDMQLATQRSVRGGGLGDGGHTACCWEAGVG